MATSRRRPPPPIPAHEEQEEDVEEDEEDEEEELQYKRSTWDRTYRFTDDDVDMSVKDFYEEYCNNLPQLVVVSQGQYGEIDLDTFCAGQVMLIHSFGTQSRVVTRDAKGRTFSIPNDYPMKFKVVKSRTKLGDEQSLSEILEQNKLPVQVRFSVPDYMTFYIGPDQQQAKDICNMVLADTYEETYMLANCIDTRDLDEKTILVPVYLKDATLSMVTGVEGLTEEEYQVYLTGLKDHMKTIKVDIKIGNKDIAFLSEDCLETDDHIYDYIEPKNWLKITFEDDDNYGVIEEKDDEDIYNAVDDDAIEGDKPPLPKRDEPKVKKTSVEKKHKSDKPALPAREKKSSVTEKLKDSPAETEKHEYVNDIPRKEVAPLSFLKNKLVGRKHSGDKEKKADESSQSVRGDVCVQDLSISELGRVLKELKLDKHVTAFKKNQIDGSIASELTKEILQSDLGFTALEAIKLMQFISTGHVPK